MKCESQAPTTQTNLPIVDHLPSPGKCQQALTIAVYFWLLHLGKAFPNELFKDMTSAVSQHMEIIPSRHTPGRDLSCGLLFQHDSLSSPLHEALLLCTRSGQHQKRTFEDCSPALMCDMRNTFDNEIFDASGSWERG